MIGARLKKERLRLGLTQRQAAERLGISDVTYRAYECGRRTPSLVFLNRMREAGFDATFVALGERLQDLFDRETDWRLLLALSDVINEWANQRPRPLDAGERATYVRLAYGWATAHPHQTAEEVVQHLLRAA